MMKRYGVQSVDRKTLDAWRKDANRTTFLFDVRDEREYAGGHVPGALSIAGGPLVQTADAWMGGRGARGAPLIDGELHALGIDEARHVGAAGSRERDGGGTSARHEDRTLGA